MVFNKAERMGVGQGLQEPWLPCSDCPGPFTLPLDAPVGPLGVLLDVQKHSEVNIMSFI